MKKKGGFGTAVNLLVKRIQILSGGGENWVLLGEDLRGRIRQIGRLEKNPQRLLIWYQDFRLGELNPKFVLLYVIV